MPTSRGRNQLEHASGTMPRRANTKPKRAASDARRMSIGSVIVTPTPTAAPLIAPMTGLVHSKIRSDTMPPPSRGTPTDVWTSLPPLLNVSPPPDRSAPAQKARPAPGDDHGAHVVVGVDPRSNAAITSYIITRVNAFSLSGRLQRDGRDMVAQVVGELDGTSRRPCRRTYCGPCPGLRAALTVRVRRRGSGRPRCRIRSAPASRRRWPSGPSSRPTGSCRSPRALRSSVSLNVFTAPVQYAVERPEATRTRAHRR